MPYPAWRVRVGKRFKFATGRFPALPSAFPRQDLRHRKLMNDSSNPLPHYVFASPEIAERNEKKTKEGLYSLAEAEIFWRDRYTFLHNNGYILRPRYHPDWKPSWLGTNRKPIFCEDSIMLSVRRSLSRVRAFG